MITTFDNKQWDKEELLANMYDDSFYYGYLGQNALSSSTIKTLQKIIIQFELILEDKGFKN